MNEQRNLLIISDINIDSGFGKEHFIYEMAKEFHHSFKVTILEPTIGSKKKNFNEDLSALGVNLEFYDNIAGTLIPVKLGSFKKFIKIIRKQDVIYLAESDPLTDILLKVFVNSKKTKLYRGYHNPLKYDIFPNGKNISKISPRRLYYKIVLIIEKNFNGVHVENTDHYRELSKLGYKNIVILPPTIDNPLFDTTSKKFEKFSVLFLGRLNYHKGSDQIPHIIREISVKLPFVDIYVAGDGILSDEVRINCELYHNCHFLGFLTNFEKDSFLGKCHVLLAPTRVEAFMLTGIESMARGTPVISFQVPGPNDYIEEGKNGYLAKNSEDMLKKINKMYTEFIEGSYERYRDNCLKTASNYYPEQRKGSFLNLISQLDKRR